MSSVHTLKAFLTTGLNIQTSYLVHICTYVPQLCALTCGLLRQSCVFLTYNYSWTNYKMPNQLWSTWTWGVSHESYFRDFTQNLTEKLYLIRNMCHIELIICNKQNICWQVLINSNKFSASGGSRNPGTSTVFPEGVVLTGHWQVSMDGAILEL